MGTLPSPFSIVDLSEFPTSFSSQKLTGLFFNDYIELNEKTGLLLGLRYEIFERSLLTDGEQGVPGSATEVSPQIGLVYKLRNNISAFASYSETFEPNVTRESEGVTIQLEPDRSRQYEFGLKTELLNDGLQISAALYDISVENFFIRSVDIGVINFFLPSFEGSTNIKSQGFELSIVGQPAPGFDIRAGYSYNNVYDTQTGLRLPNTAKNTFNLWSSYQWQRGALKGFGVGAGLFYVGNRFGDAEERIELGEYTLVDVSSWYEFRLPSLRNNQRMRLQLSVKNITNEEYFPSSGGDFAIEVGPPRSFVGSLSFDF